MIWRAVLALLSFPILASAADVSISLSPDALSAKALLEDLLVKRYSQDLATRVNKDAFTLGARIELAAVPPDDIKATEPISDLVLGSLDPEALMKKLSTSHANDLAASLLSQYRISSVNLSVGLSPELAPEKKSELEKWLKDRVRKEFGNAGKGDVNIIADKTLPPTTPKTWIDQLKDLQNLAGLLLISAAVVLSALIWSLLGGQKSDGGKDSLSLNMSQSEGGKGSSTQEQILNIERRQKEQEALATEVADLTSRIRAVLPQVQSGLEGLIRSWCQQGATGRMRLACFAEAVGREIGKLPIPVDALADLKDIFNQMTSVNMKEKRDALQKAYWDMMTVMNLGEEALSQPFAYMGSVNVDTVKQILIGQNPKLRTLVTLYLPQDLRERYLKSMDEPAKKEVLAVAAGLSKVPAQEIKTFDGTLQSKIKGAQGGDVASIDLEMGLSKLLDVMPPLEQLTLLPGLEGGAIAKLKRNRPLLAFLNEWPDAALEKVIQRANVDELLAFSRIRPDMVDKIVGLSAPLTAQMLKDELSRKDSLGETDKNRLLENLVARITELIDEKALDLADIFSDSGDRTSNLRAA